MEALDTLYLRLQTTLEDIAVETDKGDERLVNKATSLLLDLDQRISRIDDAQVKETWALRVDRLQRRLRVVTGQGDVENGSGAVIVQDVEEGVGEIDGLLKSMTITSTVDKAAVRQVPREEYVAWHGRKFKRVIRSQKGDVKDFQVRSRRPGIAGAPEGHDAVVKNSEPRAVGDERDEDAEGARYKPHHQEPLQVEIPVILPLSDHIVRSASHGSNDSTVARQGCDGFRNATDSESGDSITSPEVVNEVNSFKRM